MIEKKGGMMHAHAYVNSSIGWGQILINQLFALQVSNGDWNVVVKCTRSIDYYLLLAFVGRRFATSKVIWLKYTYCWSQMQIFYGQNSQN